VRARSSARLASVEYAALEDDPPDGRPPVPEAMPVETFANPSPLRDYTIRITIPEFTCLCPKTGQPDFATLELEYVPHERCVELKSLKLYIWSFRERGTFHEAVINEILDALARATEPRYMRLAGRFNVRGGLYTTVVADHRKPGWVPAPGVALP
jgi:7-cyano-7-deazaguanine reductase